MAIKYPTTQEIFKQLQTDFKNNCPTSNPYLLSIFQAILMALAMAISLVYYFLNFKILPNILPFNPQDIEYAEMYGNLIGAERYNGTISSGYVNFIGNQGVIIPIGTKLLDTNNNIYSTQELKTISRSTQYLQSLTQVGGIATGVTEEEHNLSSGMQVFIENASQYDYYGIKTITVVNSNTFTFPINPLADSSCVSQNSLQLYYSIKTARVLVNSQQIGSDKNLESSSQLIMSNDTFINGVIEPVYVDNNGLSGGTDLEDRIDYIKRYRTKWANPVLSFNESDINNIAIFEFGAYRSWVFPTKDLSNNDVPGSFSLYFVYDGVKKYLPTNGDVENLKNLLISKKPAFLGNNNINVAAPIIKSIDFDFLSITPNTATMKTAIINNLKNYFKNYTNVGEGIFEIDYLTVIKNTVDSNGNILTAFVLNSPSIDISANYNEIIQIGTITI